MKKTIYFLLCALLVSSCAKDFNQESAGNSDMETTKVFVRFSAASENGAGDNERIAMSRADMGAAAEEKINDVWVFQFSTDVPTDDTPLVGTALHAAVEEGQDTQLELIASQSKDQLLLFAANLGEDFVWGLPERATYKDVFTAIQTIESESDVTGKGLSMSGKYEGLVTADAVISAPLYRNTAKVELQLKPSPAYQIISVQLCNVPVSLSPFEGLNAATSAVATPVETLTYDKVLWEDGADIADGKSFTFYMPANLQGKSEIENSDESKKNLYAPESATFFRIQAKETDSSDDFYYYMTIYPGKDKTMDFNLASNTHYIYTLRINNLGNWETDSRVENDAPVTLELSNSYIINPLAGNDPLEKRSYLIPVSRINDFWGGTQVGFGNNPENVIGAEDEWVAELLWQDQNNIVGKDVATRITLGRNADEIAQGVSAGTGPDGGFVVNVPKSLGSSQFGNFSVAVKKKDSDKILWSWHFWVTDYAPELPSNISGSTFRYPVAGGDVYRYKGAAWGYSDDEYSDAVTEDTPYAKSVIMDRNLGALGLDYGTDYGRGKLYYQFGRKDPIPGKIALFDIDGNKLPLAQWDEESNRVTEKTTVVNGVFNPLTIYTGDGTANNDAEWATDAPREVSALWYDVNATDIISDKSIFDPCPPGWRVPANGVWSGIANHLEFQTDQALYVISEEDNIKTYFSFDGIIRPESNKVAHIYAGERSMVRTSTYFFNGGDSAKPRTNSTDIRVDRTSSATSSTSLAGGLSVRCVSY